MTDKGKEHAQTSASGGFTRRAALGALAGAGVVGAVAPAAAGIYSNKRMQLDLDDPVDLSVARQKVIGSLEEAEVHSLLRFHLYGQVAGEKAVPLISMNNYILDYWEPVQRGTYKLRHYEVGYYTEFDTDNPLEVWVNPYTGEELEVHQFILGPINREYTPETVIAPGLAPLPLSPQVIGNRLFLTTQAISQMPNIFQPDAWPKRSSGPMVNWLSAQTYSADMNDVLNPDLASAPAHIQLQNFVSWTSWMQMGQRPGGTTARAFGTEIDGFDALSPKLRAGFEKYTPEIFATEDWTVTRFDEFDYFNAMQEKRKNGEI